MISRNPILTINNLLAFIIQNGFDGVVCKEHEVQSYDQVDLATQVRLEKGMVDGQETLLLVIS